MNKILPIFLFLHFALFVMSCSSDDSQVNKDAIGMENLAGLDFTQTERDTFLTTLKVLKKRYDTLRTIDLPNSVPFPLYFNPRLPGQTLPTGKEDRKSTRLNSSHKPISYAVFCLKKKNLPSERLRLSFTLLFIACVPCLTPLPSPPHSL